MIRDARAQDIPGIVAFLLDRHALTHYAKDGNAQIDVVHTKKLLMTSVHRHGHKTENATWVQVAEQNGIICGLMLATLARAYSIYDKLMATDLFFITSELANPRDALDLMRNMVNWAKRSPHCIEVRCGVTSIIGDPARSGRMLEMMSMEPYGGIYRRVLE